MMRMTMPRSSGGCVVGIFAFANEPAVVLVSAQLAQNDGWRLQRLYMPLEGLSAVSDNSNAPNLRRRHEHTGQSYTTS
jgi:hypothetical protein